MSLEQSIIHGKEHRKPYHGSQRFDKTCRCHGGCNYCQGNRMHSTEVRKARCAGQIAEVITTTKEEK